MDDTIATGVDRRTVLRTAAGTAALGVGATAATGGAAAQKFGGWFSDVPNYDGVVDSRGQDEVTVEVGVDTEAGPYGFGPAALRVDPGTTVTFEWVSNTHNVVVEAQPGSANWGGVSDIHNEGYTTSHDFETEGVYRYFCDPHRRQGMKGAVVVGDVELGGGEGHGGGFVLTDSLLALGGALVMGVLSPVLFALHMRRSYEETKPDRP